MAKELGVTLENKPGTLAGLAEALGKAGVNIRTLTVVAGERGNCRIVVDDAMAARKAIEGAGMRVDSERDAVMVDLEDRPGSLGAAARKLASAGVNIDAAYMGGQSGGKTTVVFSVADAAKAKTALG
jgi:hypothetical protein